MKLKTALTACNENPMYLDFWPQVHYAWTHLQVRPIMVLVADRIPDHIEYPNDIVLFKPLGPNISTAWTAQVVRIFYPSLIETKDAVIISDIDMVPMNKDFFHNAIKNVRDDTFFCYRDVLRNEDMLPICYNAATQKTWQRMNLVSDIQQLRQAMIQLYNTSEDRWTTDQEELLRLVLEAQKLGMPFIGKQDDEDPKFYRLDRENKSLLSGAPYGAVPYSDFHMLRPQSTFRDKNAELFTKFFEVTHKEQEPKTNQKLGDIVKKKEIAQQYISAETIPTSITVVESNTDSNHSIIIAIFVIVAIIFAIVLCLVIWNISFHRQRKHHTTTIQKA